MVRTGPLKSRRITSSLMVALTVVGILFLVDTDVHAHSGRDGFLVVTVGTFGVITLYRSWQLGAKRRGRAYVPTLKRWKRTLLAVLLLLSGGLACYSFVIDHGLLIVVIFLLFAANLILILFLDVAA